MAGVKGDGKNAQITYENMGRGFVMFWVRKVGVKGRVHVFLIRKLGPINPSK